MKIETKNFEKRKDLTITLELCGTYNDRLNVLIKQKGCPYHDISYGLELQQEVSIHTSTIRYAAVCESLIDGTKYVALFPYEYPSDISISQMRIECATLIDSAFPEETPSKTGYAEYHIELIELSDEKEHMTSWKILKQEESDV